MVRREWREWHGVGYNNLGNFVLMALSCAFNFLVIFLCILGNLADTLSHGKPDTLRIIKLLHAKALFGVKYLRPGMIIATQTHVEGFYNLQCHPYFIVQESDLDLKLTYSLVPKEKHVRKEGNGGTAHLLCVVPKEGNDCTLVK